MKLKQKKIWKSILAAFTCFSLMVPLSVNAAESANEQKLKDGSYVFFEDRGATEALDALYNSKYANYTVKGDENDATSFKNMLATIEWIKECNRLRELNHLEPLLVNDTLMAMAQADANYSDTVIGHARQFNVGENLAWNYNTNPFTQWYDEEKVIYDQIHEWTSETGHYLNIINADYKTTGFAINTRGTEFPYTYAQVFSGSADGIPVEEYEMQLVDYYNSLKPEDNKSPADTTPAETTPSDTTTPVDESVINTPGNDNENNAQTASSESQTTNGDSQAASTETGDVNMAAVTANNAAFGKIVGKIALASVKIGDKEIQLIVVNGQEEVMKLANEKQKAALAMVFGVSDPQKAFVNLFKEVVKKTATKVEVVAVADISLPEGVEIPKNGMKLDIRVDSSVGIQKGSTDFYILHLTKDGVWEYIPSEATADNVLTGTFTSLSPVYIVKAEGVADIANNTTTSSTEAADIANSTTTSNTEAANIANTTTTKGAGTSDASLIWIAAVLAAGGALVAFSKKHIVK